ncbi:MAG TPA: YciI family protein [Candidatus Acidoferrum sp.]|nr:YciI family protein [Candidatus Acidoferrum sp.]
MKYICLGYYDKSKHDAMTQAEKEAMFDECFTYDEHLRANGNWAIGEALQPPETALTLQWKNGKVTTTDGPFIETKEQLGGIGILEARDMNHAHQIVSEHPSLKFGSVWEIRPVGDLTEIRKASEQRRQKVAR